MYAAGPLDLILIPVVSLLSVAFVLFFLEIGFRLGRRRATSSDVEKEASVGAMVSASLALLALLMAFTFSSAASRNEVRRTVFLDEVNAIGTVYLRTRVLPAAAREEARVLLREYAEVRVRAVQSGNVQPAIRRSVEIQTQLWEPAAKLAEQNPGSVVLSLYLQALNEMVNLHTTRLVQACADSGNRLGRDRRDHGALDGCDGVPDRPWGPAPPALDAGVRSGVCVDGPAHRRS